jgi:hypothetical protein
MVSNARASLVLRSARVRSRRRNLEPLSDVAHRRIDLEIRQPTRLHTTSVAQPRLHDASEQQCSRTMEV